MTTRKPAEPGQIYEFLKVCENDSVKKLAEVASNLLEGKEMPESWRSDLIPTNLQKEM